MPNYTIVIVVFEFPLSTSKLLQWRRKEYLISTKLMLKTLQVTCNHASMVNKDLNHKI